MRRPILTLVLFTLALGFAAPGVLAAVELAVEADGDQPAGGPIILKLTMTNSGKEPVGWWCGGPDVYPGAEHFLIELRDSGTDVWRRAAATNGQYIEGSGSGQKLTNGASIVVPLAIPIDVKRDSAHVRVTPRTWPAARPAEIELSLLDNQTFFDTRRARMIGSIFPGASAFWRHVAEKYADAVVIDAMLKLVAVDNAPIAQGAARILSDQPSLPESAGNALAPLLAQWLPRYHQPDQDLVGFYLLRAGLNTRSESVRRTALELLRDSADSEVRKVLVDALRLSPGDEEWLQRVREALLYVAQLQGKDPDFDPDLARKAKAAVDWVESRLEKLAPKP